MNKIEMDEEDKDDYLKPTNTSDPPALPPPRHGHGTGRPLPANPPAHDDAPPLVPRQGQVHKHATPTSVYPSQHSGGYGSENRKSDPPPPLPSRNHQGPDLEEDYEEPKPPTNLSNVNKLPTNMSGELASAMAARQARPQYNAAAQQSGSRGLPPRVPVASSGIRGRAPPSTPSDNEENYEEPHLVESPIDEDTYEDPDATKTNFVPRPGYPRQQPPPPTETDETYEDPEPTSLQSNKFKQNPVPVVPRTRCALPLPPDRGQAVNSPETPTMEGELEENYEEFDEKKVHVHPSHDRSYRPQPQTTNSNHMQQMTQRPVNADPEPDGEVYEVIPDAPPPPTLANTTPVSPPTRSREPAVKPAIKGGVCSSPTSE